MRKMYVLETIKGLKANKAGGVDGFNSSYLKEVAEVISLSLTLIFRESLAAGGLEDG